jgi:hypothetical protein
MSSAFNPKVKYGFAIVAILVALYITYYAYDSFGSFERTPDMEEANTLIAAINSHSIDI